MIDCENEKNILFILQNCLTQGGGQFGLPMLSNFDVFIHAGKKSSGWSNLTWDGMPRTIQLCTR